MFWCKQTWVKLGSDFVHKSSVSKEHPKAVAQTLPAPIDLNLIVCVWLQKAQWVAAPGHDEKNLFDN